MPEARGRMVRLADEPVALGECAALIQAAAEASEAMVAAKLAARESRERYVPIRREYWTALADMKEARRQAKMAKAAMNEAYEAVRSAARAAYREWRRAHPSALLEDQYRFFREIARLAGVSVGQVMRLAGIYQEPRTPEELQEDCERASGGWSQRTIAMARGVTRRAVGRGVVRRQGERVPQTATPSVCAYTRRSDLGDPPPQRGPRRRRTPAQVAEGDRLLAEGISPDEVARRQGVSRETIVWRAVTLRADHESPQRAQARAATALTEEATLPDGHGP